MLQDKKLEFQRQLEDYLEEQSVYDIFEDMMKSLIINRPKDPLGYLVKKLTTPESKHGGYSSMQLSASLSWDHQEARGRRLPSLWESIFRKRVRTHSCASLWVTS